MSDGEDTCAPPAPCDVARQLHEQGADLTVHTVGFKVDARARRQLQCIAGATGGVYRDAEDGSSLSTQLQKQVSRALQGYRTKGAPIRGSDNAGDGPGLEPGQYVDSLDPVDPTTRERSSYYTIEPPAGATPLAATLVPPARRATNGTGLSLRVSLSRLETPYCSVSASVYDIGLNSTVTTATAMATPTSDSDRSVPRQCAAGGQGHPVGTGIRRAVAADRDCVPVELAAEAQGLAGAASAQPDVTPDVGGASVPLRSGSSFNDALRVDRGVYRDSFVSGESRYVKVHLEWGQRLAFTLTPTQVRGLGVGEGVVGQVTVLNPVRRRVDLAGASYAITAYLGSSQSTLHGSTKAPARYTNRRSELSSIRDYQLAGDYYVVLSTAFTARGKPSITVPYTLHVAVLGQAERGPVYGRAGGTGTGSGSGAGEPTSTGPTSGSAFTSTGPPGAPTSTALQNLGEHRAEATRTPLLIAIGAGPAVAAGLIVVLTARRRRPGTHEGTPPSW